ncbi:NmrA/HSCARG family protein [Deinococcus oregonensis]|uniref:NmrA/HSCARG family protein n=1 Tax=Deinococcus oregonensis TaxID=1805970 RepID=A0ABV6AX90_9DEIO
MTNGTRRILVTGATGKQGGAVARSLLDAGFPVRAMTRDLSKPAARFLAKQGAEVVAGNLDDPTSLQRALEGVYGVFSVQNYWEKNVGFNGELRQGKNLGDAARAADVQHFVQSTMARAKTFQGVEHFEAKRAVERALKELGLPVTLIGTVYFMDNLLDPKMGGSLTLPILSGALGRDTPFQMMAVEDLGPIVTAVFQHPHRYIGERIDVAGDLLTVGEMKAIYRQVSGKRPKAYPLPTWLLQVMNREFAAQLRWHNRREWTFGAREAQATYPGMTTFEQFLRQHQIGNL